MNYKKLFHRLLQCLKLKKGVCCKKGERNRFSHNCYLHEMATVGNSNFFGEYVKVMNAKVGNYCSIADGVKIGLMEHDLNCISTSWRIFEPKQGLSDHTGWLAPAIIENDVWIASNAVIKQGVTVHNGAVIGAGAVVVKDVPPYAIVGGVPAKIIRYRFSPEVTQLIEESKWWDYPEWEARKICKQLKERIEEINNR